MKNLLSFPLVAWAKRSDESAKVFPTTVATQRPALILSSAALAFAMGMGAALVLQSNKGPAAQITPAATAVEPPETQLLALLRDTNWNEQVPAEPIEALAASLSRSDLIRAEVLKRYQQETQDTAKSNLRMLLTSGPNAEVAAAALTWAEHPTSVATRADGLTLLTAQPPNIKTYNLAKQALEQETDPKLLAAATWALRFPQEVVDPAEAQSVVPRLHALTQHSDPRVRGASIQRLAVFDRFKRHLEQDVLRLLSDPDPNVRIAAVGATSIAALSSDSIKQGLFDMLGSDKSDPELRSAVLLQMDRFGLSPQEFSIYRATHQELFGDSTQK